MRKKEAIRFEVKHPSGREIAYELNGTDIQDTLLIQVNTWGHAGIHVTTTADFIEPQTHVLWTDEFERGQDVLDFTIRADKVLVGRRHGEIILQTPYEKKVIRISAHNQQGEGERKSGGEGKGVDRGGSRNIKKKKKNRGYKTGGEM